MSQTDDEKILNYIQRTPGATLDRICVYMGLGVTRNSKGKPSYPTAIKKAVKRLQDDGLIHAKKSPFAGRYDPEQFYPGAAPDVEAEAGTVAKRLDSGTVKTTVDPTLAGTAPATPVRSPIADLPYAQPTMNAYQKKLAKLKELCDRMVQEGRIIPATELSRQVCGLSNWIHTSTGGKRMYQEAVQQVKAARGDEGEGNGELGVESGEEVEVSPPPPQSSPPSPPPLSAVVELEEEIHQLRQQLEQKTRRLTELETELEQTDGELAKATAYVNHLETELNTVKQSEPNPKPNDPQVWIVSQLDTWLREVKRLGTELAIAQKHLSAFQLLAELYETELPLLPLTLNPLQENHGTDDQVSGRNGNGRWAHPDQPQALALELPRSLGNGESSEGFGALD